MISVKRITYNFHLLDRKIVKKPLRRLKIAKISRNNARTREKFTHSTYPLTFERECMRNGSRRARVERSRSPRNPRALTIVSRSRTRKKGFIHEIRIRPLMDRVIYRLMRY